MIELVAKLVSFFVEIKKIESGAREHIQRIFNDHEKIKQQLANQKRELELEGHALEKREVVNENEQKKLLEEIEKVRHFMNGHLCLLWTWQNWWIERVE